MEDMQSKIEVHYKDDNGFKHITYIKTQKEVAFLQNRFGKDAVIVKFLTK